MIGWGDYITPYREITVRWNYGHPAPRLGLSQERPPTVIGWGDVITPYREITGPIGAKLRIGKVKLRAPRLGLGHWGWIPNDRAVWPEGRHYVYGIDDVVIANARLRDPGVFTFGEPDDYVICMNRQSPTVIEGVM